jgi:hypothetical protein
LSRIGDKSTPLTRFLPSAPVEPDNSGLAGPAQEKNIPPPALLAVFFGDAAYAAMALDCRSGNKYALALVLLPAPHGNSFYLKLKPFFSPFSLFSSVVFGRFLLYHKNIRITANPP